MLTLEAFACEVFAFRAIVWAWKTLLNFHGVKVNLRISGFCCIAFFESVTGAFV